MEGARPSSQRRLLSSSEDRHPVRIRIRPEDKRRAAARAAAVAEGHKPGGGGEPENIRTADELLRLAAESTERMHAAEDRKRAASASVTAQDARGGSSEATEGGAAAAGGKGGADGEALDENETGRKEGRERRTEPKGDGADMGSRKKSGDSRDAGEEGDKQGSRKVGNHGVGMEPDAAGKGRRDRKEDVEKQFKLGGSEGKAEEKKEQQEGRGAIAWSRIKFFRGRGGGGDGVAKGDGTGKTGGGAGAGAGSDSNRTVLPPALAGYNLSWSVLDAAEERMREDARSAADAYRRSRERRRGQGVQSVQSPLSAELVRGCARDGLVIMTWASAAFLDFLANWVHHLVLQEADNFLIGAAR